MGITGPIPNRSDQRVRRNKPDVPITKVTAIGTVLVPPLNIDNAHPIVVDLYNSLKDSAQAKFYEPSDWQFARLAMIAVDDMLTPARNGYGISAMKLSAVNQMLTSLLLTEGDRRRVRMEVERSGGEGGEVINLADLYKAHLGAS